MVILATLCEALAEKERLKREEVVVVVARGKTRKAGRKDILDTRFS